MKKPLFAVGQAVMWGAGGWIQTSEITAGLSRFDVYRVLGYYRRIVKGKRYLYLAEIGKAKAYSENGFKLVDILSDNEIADLLTEMLGKNNF